VQNGALNDGELDDADLIHMYMHVSELADDADDADDTKDEELVDREYKDNNNGLKEVMDADLTPA